MSLPNNLQLCRLCLFEKSSYVDIFEMNSKHGFRIADVINEMLELDVSPGDGFPDRICQDCLNEMARFKRFKNLCQEAKLTLKYIIALATGAMPPPTSLPSFLTASINNSLCDSKKTTCVPSTSTLHPQPTSTTVSQPPGSSAQSLAADKQVSSCSSLAPSTNSVVSFRHEVPSVVKTQSCGITPINVVSTVVTPSCTMEPPRSTETVSACVQVNLDDCVAPSDSYSSCRISQPQERKDKADDRQQTDSFTEVQEDSDAENLCEGPLPVETVLSEPDAEVDHGNRTVEVIQVIPQNGEREDSFGMFPISSIINDLMTPSAEESGSCFSRSAPTVAHTGQFPINSNEVVTGPLENPNKYPFWCPICGKNFMRKDKLKQHSVVHSNERPFICRICGCSYKRKDKLTSHVTSSHLQHLPHQCDICGKRFVRKDKLKQHSVVHSNRRPFVCKLCDKKYKSKTELKKHEKRAHQ